MAQSALFAHILHLDTQKVEFQSEVGPFISIVASTEVLPSSTQFSDFLDSPALSDNSESSEIPSDNDSIEQNVESSDPHQTSKGMLVAILR